MIQHHRLSPSRTVVTSFNPLQSSNQQECADEEYFAEGDWVTSVASSNFGQHLYICCALSNGEVQVYDQQRMHLVRSYTEVHGKSPITDLVYGPQKDSNILASSGIDGKVCLFDLRMPSNSPQPAMGCSLPNHQQALSVSLGYDGHIGAVASNKGKINFFDFRATRDLIGCYANSHTDEVTKVRFQPQLMSSSTSPLLLSGSEDGLACLFDTSSPTEEAALKSVLNVQSPLRQLGFCGSNLEAVFCMTGSETMSIWHWESAQRLQDYGNIRETIRQTTGQQAPVDYLVDAHWDYCRNELLVLSGRSNGDAFLSRIIDNNRLTTSHLLCGGHRGVVRGWSTLSASVLVTVGEDARLCEWNLTGVQLHGMSSNSSAAGATKSSSQSNKFNRNLEAPLTGGSRGGRVRRQRNRCSAAPY